MDFCVYLTTYRGNKLPPFYIGSTSVKRINNGYIGSVSSKRYKTIWASEKKKHPEKFSVKVISLYSTRVEAATRELELQKQLQVQHNPMYVNTGYFSGGHLVYSMTSEEIKAITEKRKGYKHSDETKRKIGNGNKGKKHSPETLAKFKMGRIGAKNHQFGKTLTEEHKRKIGTAQLGPNHHFFGKELSDEHKEKLRISQLGKSKIRRKRTDEENLNYVTCFWEITDSENNVEIVKILSNWCKEQNLDIRNVRRAFNTRGKYKDYTATKIDKF